MYSAAGARAPNDGIDEYIADAGGCLSIVIAPLLEAAVKQLASNRKITGR